MPFSVSASLIGSGNPNSCQVALTSNSLHSCATASKVISFTSERSIDLSFSSLKSFFSPRIDFPGGIFTRFQNHSDFRNQGGG
jgi:hypothetical protein